MGFKNRASIGGINDVVDDTTPQLGGDLDGQGNNLNNMGVLFLTEQTEADASVGGKGQLWVDLANPNILMFTDDVDTDFTIANDATTTLSSLVTVGTLSSGNATAIVDAASDTVAGKIELATDAETTTGTATDRATTPANVQAKVDTIDYAKITGNDGATDVTAAQLEELTDASETILHSHAGGLTTVSGFFNDLRDNRGLLFYQASSYNNRNNGQDTGIGCIVSLSGGVVGDSSTGATTGIRFRIDSGAASTNFGQLRTLDAGALPTKNPEFAIVCTSSVGSAELTIQAWGFDDGTGTTMFGDNSHMACFRSKTTGTLFAVTGDGSSEETTDLTSFHTLNNEAKFEVITTDAGVTWKFEIDGTQRASHSTTVPVTSTQMRPGVHIKHSASGSTTRTINGIDFVYAHQDR